MSKTRELEEAVRGTVRITQLICVAFCLGPLLHGAVIAVAFADGQAERGNPITTGALLVGLAAIVLNPLVGGVVGKQAVSQWSRRGADTPELAKAHMSKTIVMLAMCEGAAFFNLMVYGFLDAAVLLLAMAGLLVAVMAMKFPTVAGVAEWCQRAARGGA